MTQAAVPLPEALRLAAATLPRRRGTALDGAVQGLLAGLPLGQALARSPGCLDAVDIALLEAATHHGHLAAACATLAARHHAAAAHTQALAKSLRYPIGLAVTTALLQPAAIAIQRGALAWLQAAAWNLLLLAVAAGVLWQTWRWLRSDSQRWLGVAVRVPGLRGAVLARRWALWFEVLGAAVDAGVPLPEALHWAATATTEATMVDAAASATAQLRGPASPTLAEVISALPSPPDNAAAVIAAAERSGHLADALRELAVAARLDLQRRLTLLRRVSQATLLAAVLAASAWSVAAQMQRLAGGSLATLEGPEAEELRRELDRALPGLLGPAQ